LFTKEQIDKRTSDYICFDCGNKFLTEEQKNEETVSTMHMSKCGLCGKEKGVCHMRHFNWLNKKTRHKIDIN